MSTDTITNPSDTKSLTQGRWRVDRARSSIEFRTPTLWGLATVKGRFDRYDGTLDLERSPAIELTIDAGSINTNNSFRDKHLRSADFFDADNHATVRFASDSAALEGDTLKVSGRLYAAAKILPLDMDASLRRVGDELEVEARTYGDHRELGMSNGLLGMIRTPSELIVHARLVR